MRTYRLRGGMAITALPGGVARQFGRALSGLNQRWKDIALRTRDLLEWATGTPDILLGTARSVKKCNYFTESRNGWKPTV